MCKDKTLQSIQHTLFGGEMERANEIREMEIKISLNKNIISLPKEGTELVLPLKTDGEEA